MKKIIRTVINLLSKVECFYYTWRAKMVVNSYGSDLRVNHKSLFNSKVKFGNNCNFNGMRISGAGSVEFGNNFHSGINCMIITSNHNFDHGTAVPYDNTYIHKSVQIEDNVWFGNNVIVMGGGKNWRGGDHSCRSSCHKECG